MTVPDHNFRRIDHAKAIVQPAIAKLPVLTGRIGEIGVKAFDCSEQVRRQSQVVGGKKPCPVGNAIRVLVKVIDEQLTGEGFPSVLNA